MTVSLLPIRLTWWDRPTGKHREDDAIDLLQCKLTGQRILTKGLRLQLDAKDRELDESDAWLVYTAAARGEAEALAARQQADLAELTAERNYWRGEALALRARFSGPLATEANATAVTVPCGYRDTSAIEDQATGPIDVRPLWAAADAGLLGTP